MHELARRSNFETLEIDGKVVVLYEDHRSLLFALWHAKRCGLLETPHTLVTFDLHDDAVVPSAQVRAQAQSFRDGGGNERDFMSFIEWELGSNDDDWMVAALELNLVGDVVNVGAEIAHNLPNFETPIVDAAGSRHRVWRIDHLWNALGHQGDLVDTSRRPEPASFWDALGWDPRERQFSDETRVLLDFDLDCFSIQGPRRRIAWPEDSMLNLFRRPSNPPGHTTAADVLLELAARAPFITIARESRYCGGTEESQRILATLDVLLFDGGLLAR